MRIKGFIVFLIIILSHHLYAGGPNPTGGFGQSNEEPESGPGGINFPTGNFGVLSADGSPPDTDPGNPPGVPIDGGAALIIGAGLALGGRKILKGLKSNV